ncbi:MAG: vanadium-dependent haloperoxidase [Gemmatimonadota bacterium]
MPSASTFRDDFNDGTFSGNWNAWGPVREVNGRIEMRPVANGTDDWTGISSVGVYDLTDSYFSVEVVQVLYSGDGHTTFEAQLDLDNRCEIAVSDGRIRAQKRVGGLWTSLSSAPYDPVAHRFWRIRHRSSLGQVFWEVSPDRKSWTALYVEGAPFAVTAVVVVVGAGLAGGIAVPGMAVFDSLNTPGTALSRRVEERRLSAREVRENAAAVAAARVHPEHFNNNDEVNHPDEEPFVGSYSKGLRHDALGDPEPISYGSLLRALESRDPGDFEEIVLGGALKLVNPQAGLAFELSGPDPQAVTMPPAPRFASDVTAHEMGELYWMAVARDVPFASYGTDPVIAAAVSSLNSEFPRYGGPSPVTTQNVFRGIYPGEQVGPYVSQFLLKGNADPRKPDGQGRDADEGYVTYGAQRIDQRVLRVRQGVDHLTQFSAWLAAQNGADTRGQDFFDPSFIFIRSLRDGANYVHFDQVVNAFYNAAFILLSEPSGSQLSGAGLTTRPQVDMEFRLNEGNPYDPPGSTRDSRTQVGFCTFGPEHILQALVEVAGRACRAVWWQKWGVHRRLRPEEYGGRVHNQVTGARSYPLDPSITSSLTAGALAPYFGQAGEKFPNSYLLPQAYSEGAPTHPAYGAGHATISGACATILKAFFDETKSIESPVYPRGDGLALLAYTGADAAQMTVGGEINKLAGNIALFRNAAGVHWRSDYTFSLPLGEAVAIGLLQEMSLLFNEDDAFFQLTRFDGTTIRIFDGCVEAVD